MLNRDELLKDLGWAVQRLQYAQQQRDYHQKQADGWDTEATVIINEMNKLKDALDTLRRGYEVTEASIGKTPLP
jgi:hypothetical protein